MSTAQTIATSKYFEPNAKFLRIKSVMLRSYNICLSRWHEDATVDPPHLPERPPLTDKRVSLILAFHSIPTDGQQHGEGWPCARLVSAALLEVVEEIEYSLGRSVEATMVSERVAVFVVAELYPIPDSGPQRNRDGNLRILLKVH